jgi:hypothetical protein
MFSMALHYQQACYIPLLHTDKEISFPTLKVYYQTMIFIIKVSLVRALGHISWVVTIIEKGANSWDEAFQAACKAGNVDIIMMLHSRVRNNTDQGKSSSIISYDAGDWNKGLYGAAKGGHILVTLMINKGTTNWML